MDRKVSRKIWLGITAVIFVYTAVLTDGELRIYDITLREQIAYYEVTGGLEVIIREKGDAIVAMRHSAHVYPADTK